MKQLKFAALLLCACFIGCASTQSKPRTTSKCKRCISIAVLPFSVTTQASQAGKNWESLSNLISAELLNRPIYQVVERSELEKVVDEMRLGASGAISAATAAQIGRLIGAKAMIFGTVAQFGETYLVTVRAVRVETGELVGGDSAKASSIRELDRVTERVGRKLLDRLPQFFSETGQLDRR